MCHEFESWFLHRRSAQPVQREQVTPPVKQQPPVAPVAPGVKVFEPAPRFTEREKQPA